MVCLHRSLLVSISPNNSLLPPLRDVPADVADATDDMVENAVDGLLARAYPLCLSCLRSMIDEDDHSGDNERNIELLL